MVQGGGLEVFWLWKGVYLTNALNLKMSISTAYNWFMGYMFGRDISRF